jgi:hypothetical protein
MKTAHNLTLSTSHLSNPVTTMDPAPWSSKRNNEQRAAMAVVRMKEIREKWERFLFGDTTLIGLSQTYSQQQ